MQPNKVFLEHLFNVLVQGSKNALSDSTPNALTPQFTPNQKFLEAAVAYVDACYLKAPGKNASQATELAQLCFQLQQQYGHHCIPHDPSQPGSGLGPTGAIELLTPSHAQLWHAGGAALLYCALQAGDDTLIGMAQKWWRGEAALNHLTAWQVNWPSGSSQGSPRGSYQVIAPGARGGSDTASSAAAHNSARDLDYELLLTGELLSTTVSTLQSEAAQVQTQTDSPKPNPAQYFTAPLILLKMSEHLNVLNQPGSSGTPLPGPTQNGPWTTSDLPTLPSPTVLSVLRNGNQHAAWFNELDALQPQLQAGVKGGAAWYEFYDSRQPSSPGVNLENGGKSPWPDPIQPSGTVQHYPPS